MIVLMKCLDEEKTVRRCVGDFHDEPWVDKIVVIDGGSTDMTVHELRKFPKVQVHVHPWLDWYHDMEVSQSNIALSYIRHGSVAFILDFDERMSEQLKGFLAEVNKYGMPHGADVAHFSRRTMDVLRYEDSPYAMLGDDGWPIESNQIGQYPDFQCRLICRKPGMHWINSPHHVLFGYETNVNIQADILHYEKDDLRDRQRVEKKWARAQARRKELGLVADRFEASNAEFHKYTLPETWE